MKHDVIDAEWTPTQQAAADYSRRVRRARRRVDQIKTAKVQRLFVFSAGLLLAVVIVALAIT